MVVVCQYEGWQAGPSIESSAVVTGAMATSRDVAAVERSSVVCLLSLRKLLWRSYSKSKLQTIVVVVTRLRAV